MEFFTIDFPNKVARLLEEFAIEPTLYLSVKSSTFNLARDKYLRNFSL